MTQSLSNTEQAQHYFELGLAAFDQGSYQEAIEQFSNGIKVRPESSGLWLNRSIAYEKLNQLPEALDDLLAYLNLKSEDLSSWHRALKLAQKLSCLQKVLKPLAHLSARQKHETFQLSADYYDLLIAGHLIEDRFLDQACQFAKQANAKGLLTEATTKQVLMMLRLVHLQSPNADELAHIPKAEDFIADLTSKPHAQEFLLPLWLDQLSLLGQLKELAPSALLVWLANHGDDQAADRLLISFLVERNQIDLMEPIFFERLKKDPENIRHMLSVAEVCLFKRDNRHAYTLVNAAVSKDPKNILARELRVEVFRQLGLPKMAIAEIRAILDMDPDNWKAKIIEIGALMQLGKVEEAGELVQELSLQAIPHAHELDFTFAKTTYLKDKGDYEGLQTYLDEIKPHLAGHPGVNFEQAWLDMANGKFESGFALFESRFARGLHYYPLEPYLANTKIPKLSPQLCQKLKPGQSVMVTCEEGFGDAIQFWRFLPQMQKLGVKITVVASSPVGQLFAENYPDIPFISAEEMHFTIISGQKLPFDAYVEIMSLPHILGISHLPIDTTPYLKPNPQRNLAMKEMLDSRFPKKRFRLGLRWQREGAGSPRCMDLKLLSPLADLPIDIVSLHYGSLTDKDMHTVADWDNFLHTSLNFVDLTAMMSQLDCVLSVDTVTTHVAGAIGHPTIAMIPTFINWRWGRDLAYSPWYEKQMIIRQSRYQSWEDVSEKAIAEVKRRVG